MLTVYQQTSQVQCHQGYFYQRFALQTLHCIASVGLIFILVIEIRVTAGGRF